MKTALIALGTAVLLSSPATADPYHDAMDVFLEENIRAWASDPVLINAIKAQNQETGQYDQAQIDELDQLWRAYAGSSEAPMIQEVLANPAADFLREQAAASGGAITEAFVMDAMGLNVAASVATSDYWQGDEAKHQKTYAVGPSAVHFGDAELDDSTNTVQAQISISIVDDVTGDVIGAMTVGVDLSSLL